MHTIILSTFVILMFDGVSTGKCTASICSWEPWEPWSSCSNSCGGGSRRRTRLICCKLSLVSDVNACLRDCNKPYSGFFDEQSCNSWCYNRGTIHYSGKSCICLNAYYGYCCQNECINIAHCEKRTCTNAANAVCQKCVDDNVFFKTWNGSKECQRICAWNNHYCWPGSCGTSGLTKDCNCADGFVKRFSAEETTCQLNRTPDILIFGTFAIEPNGETKQAKRTTATTTCLFQADIYINYKPSTIVFNMTTELAVESTKFNALKPPFIKEERFGITDTAINIKIQTVEGSFVVKWTRSLLKDTTLSTSVKPVHSDLDNINVNDFTTNLQNGEALCLEFEAKGGGYLKSIDTRSLANTTSTPVPYTKVTRKRTVCYRFDDVPPIHCSELSTCEHEALMISNRVTKSSILKANFIGWTDSIPSTGNNKTASGIEGYELAVYSMHSSNQSILKVDHIVHVFHETVSANVTTITFNILSDVPTLYVIYLGVHDKAGNVRRARRFVLYDNTSLIDKSKESQMYFKTTYPDSDFKWQNNSNVCLTWKNYFVNELYVRNNYLNAIESDPRFNITGVYEQNTGLLPVSGTPNVNGIVRFFMSRCDGGDEFTPQVLIPNLTQQQFCERVNLTDGQETIWRIQAVDVAGNTLSDERSLIFDATPPTVSNVQLIFNQYELEYIQRFSDLRKLALRVTAKDDHSGVYAIDVGVTNGASYRSIAKWISNKVECSATPNCYCVQSGQCQISFHFVQLDTIGNFLMLLGADMCSGQCEMHVIVINQAGSSTVQMYHLKIDETVPETRNAKIDIVTETSSLNSSTARLEWSGFDDQESGIVFYRVHMFDYCLTTNETSLDLTTTSYTELNASTRMIEVSRDFAGTRYATVVAFNGALTASLPMCSEGIKGVVPFPSNADQNNTAVPIGASIGVVMAIVIISLGAVFYVKKYRSNTHESSDVVHFKSDDEAYDGVTNRHQKEHIYSRYTTPGVANPYWYEMDKKADQEDICKPGSRRKTSVVYENMELK